jgi:hypothetical protein
MKHSRLTLSLSALIALAVSPVANAADKDCSAEYKKVNAAVSAEPDKVLKIVATSVGEAPGCVCEIVKAAIKGASADKDLIVQIVTTASEILPDETPTIISCAISSAPEAIQGEVARAIADKFGSGKGVVESGKEPAPTGKGTAQPEPEPEWDDFNLFHSGIGGIYLTTPSGGLSPGGLPPVAVPLD